ncbi:hypothetical protein ABZP36_025183 [Zizania latifolia]
MGRAAPAPPTRSTRSPTSAPSATSRASPCRPILPTAPTCCTLTRSPPSARARPSDCWLRCPRASPASRGSPGPLSLPSQLAAQRNFGNKFALCLPGFAAFGDTPVYIGSYNAAHFELIEYRSSLPYTPLLANPRNAGYYIPVKGISVSWNGVHLPVSLPTGALDLDTRSGRGGVVLSTVTPYAIMRPDVFRSFSQAFDAAIDRGKYTDVVRVPAVGPFKLCYAGAFPLRKRPPTYDVPWIHLELQGGATGNWTLFNGNYLVQLPEALCVGILEMGPGGMPVDGEPAMVLGLKQLEKNLLVFDLDKMVMWFSELLDIRLFRCDIPA